MKKNRNNSLIYLYKKGSPFLRLILKMSLISNSIRIIQIESSCIEHNMFYKINFFNELGSVSQCDITINTINN